MTTQPVCLTRPLCQVPPKQPEAAKETTSDKKDETKENFPESHDAAIQPEDKGPSHETRQLAEEKAELKPSEASTDSSAKEETVEREQGKISDKKAASQKKLHDLLSTLATVRIYFVSQFI